MIDLDLKTAERLNTYVQPLSKDDRHILGILQCFLEYNPQQKYIDHVIHNSYLCGNIEEVEDFCKKNNLDIEYVKDNIIKQAINVAVLDFYNGFIHRFEKIIADNRNYLLYGDEQGVD